MTDWKLWYRSLTKEEKQAYAERAGTTRTYIEVQLVSRRRIPRKDLMHRLASASLGRVGFDDVVRFFLIEGKKAA